MLIILRGFFVCLPVWLVLLCVALLGGSQCRLTLRVLHAAMRCRAPFNPLMHRVLVGFKMFACFVFVLFCFFCKDLVHHSLASLACSKERKITESLSHLNSVSIVSGSSFGSSCLAAVSSQSAHFDTLTPNFFIFFCTAKCTWTFNS